MMFDRIPQEMRGFNQWIVWRAEETQEGKPTKVPYQAATRKLASVVNPEHWTTFDAACAAVAAGWASGIGFVFTANDPFAGIDLDATDDESIRTTQQHIYSAMNSYTEFSPSGAGVHIIVKGDAPSGRRRKSIELYSRERFFTMTGNVLNPAPIADRSVEVVQLWQQLNTSTVPHVSHDNAPQTEDDATIWNRAADAENGEKFKNLWNGDWQITTNERTGAPYPSQSEADQSLINIIAFFTQNREQIERLFLASGLGQRKKAQRKDYIARMIDKSFDLLPSPVDFAAMKKDLEAMIEAVKAKQIEAKPSLAVPDAAIPIPAEVATYAAPEWNPYSCPPGLMGEIAQFIFAASPRPVACIALAGAIGLMSGICGRAWNVSGTGLNTYTLLLAGTGRGKESMASGIDRIIKELRNQEPNIGMFRGPAEIASGQALVKFMVKQPSFVSIIGEFGYRMQAMASPIAPSSEKMLKRAMLDLYNKSGHFQTYQPTIHADPEKNTALLDAPALSILAESTPETFWAAVDERLISDGLLPRFMTIEYSGPRVALNKDHIHARPSFEFAARLTQLVKTSLLLMRDHNVINVTATADAEAFLDDFEAFATSEINNATQNSSVREQLWNRAHMKVMRLAALVAVGCNDATPVITLEMVQWAKGLVVHEVSQVMKRFNAGLMGAENHEMRQRQMVMEAVLDYVTSPWDQRFAAYGATYNMHAAAIIPWSYFQRKLTSQMPFKPGAVNTLSGSRAIQAVVQSLVDEDVLRLVPASQAAPFATKQRLYVLHDQSLLIGRRGQS